MNAVKTPNHVLRLQGVQCPFNYVKTKLYMEDMDLGETIEVVVDEGEPSRHVPKSLTEDGQTVLNTFKDGEGLVHIVIEKTADY